MRKLTAKYDINVIDDYVYLYIKSIMCEIHKKLIDINFVRFLTKPIAKKMIELDMVSAGDISLDLLINDKSKKLTQAQFLKRKLKFIIRELPDEYENINCLDVYNSLTDVDKKLYNINPPNFRYRFDFIIKVGDKEEHKIYFLKRPEDFLYEVMIQCSLIEVKAAKIRNITSKTDMNFNIVNNLSPEFKSYVANKSSKL